MYFIMFSISATGFIAIVNSKIKTTTTKKEVNCNLASFRIEREREAMALTICLRRSAKRRERNISRFAGCEKSC